MTDISEKEPDFKIIKVDDSAWGPFHYDIDGGFTYCYFHKQGDHVHHYEKAFNTEVVWIGLNIELFGS